MKSFLSIYLLLAFALTSSWAMAQKPETSTPEKNKQSVTQIMLQRTWCYGSCPIDRLVLNADGSASYEIDAGNRQSKAPEGKKYGYYTSAIWSGTFKLLTETLERQGFFDLKPDDDADNIDSPDIIINLVRDGHNFTVVRHGTSSLFWTMEKIIVGVSADLRWQKDDAFSASGVKGSTRRTFSSEEVAQFANSSRKIEEVPVPYALVTIFPSRSAANPIFRTFADSRGDFQIMLPPGEYMISAGGKFKLLGSSFPAPLIDWSAQTQVVKVEAGKFTEVALRAKPAPK